MAITDELLMLVVKQSMVIYHENNLVMLAIPALEL